jgi:hypothetical protein
VLGSDRKRTKLSGDGGDTGIGPTDRRYGQEEDSCEQESTELQVYSFSPK